MRTAQGNFTAKPRIMSHETIQLRTADGTCPVHVFEPDDKHGRLPGALIFMDALGMRPAMYEIAARLASNGYHVLLPDLYYRSGFTDGPRIFSDRALLDHWKAHIQPTMSIANIMRDMPSFLEHLDTHAALPNGKIGVTGYCMGGRLSLASAGHFPDRVAAAASYHGGGLATDAPDSPHRLAPAMKARIYVAGAIDDSGFDDAQKQRLEDALTAAGVDHRVETYNARHGWVPSDTPVHDPVETEHHWRTLLALFEGRLSS